MPYYPWDWAEDAHALLLRAATSMEAMSRAALVTYRLGVKHGGEGQVSPQQNLTPESSGDDFRIPPSSDPVHRMCDKALTQLGQQWQSKLDAAWGVTTLTDAERCAVRDAADRYAEISPESAETAATLRGLLEREATAQVVAETATSCGLTDAERSAVVVALGELNDRYPDAAVTLRGLLDRMGGER